MVTKKMKNVALALILVAASTIGLNAAQKGDNAMTKMADGSYVVNTTTLANDVKGYRGTTPLKITIKKDKVEKIEALKNQETPKYFVRVKREMMSAWDGLKVSKAEKLNPDGVTGATMSSDAVKENVKRGLKYYKSHK
jgi:electron transport complex protein RnfG